MNPPTTAKPAQTTPIQFASVFTSGNSQAVRLPKAFRVDSSKVEILRRGNEIVLRPYHPTLADVLATLAPLTESDAHALDEMMSTLHNEALPDDVRDWNLFDTPPPALAAEPQTRYKRRKPAKASGT
jgi:antitoxin VapB